MKKLFSLLLSSIVLLSVNADSLQDQLDAFKAEFESGASEEVLREFNNGIEAVAASGVLEKALKAGDTAPDFTLKNAVGEKLTLSDLLKQGPVILTWYRGSWCPYCNITLQAYQGGLSTFTDQGAQLVVLTPELPDHSLSIKEKYSLGFEVLTDLNNQVAEQFNLVYKMTPWVEQFMREFADLKKYNGPTYQDSMMPLSATYVIKPDGTIAWAFLDAKYSNRATPEQILEALKKIE